MAATKVREKVTSQADVMRHPVDAMGVGEAPLGGGAFWGGAMTSAGGIRQRVKVRFADVMWYSSS